MHGFQAPFSLRRPATSAFSYQRRPSVISEVNPAVALLGNEPAGFAFDAESMQLYIKDPTNPANDYLGDANGRLIHSSPSIKNIWTKEGVLESGLALRCEFDPLTREALGIRLEGAATNTVVNSDSPASQDITVPAVPLTLSFWGTGSIVLAGVFETELVGTGSGPKDRTSLTFTPEAGTLSLAISGDVTRCQLEEGGFASSYIRTTTAPVRRGGDSIHLMASLLPHNPTSGALAVEFTPSPGPEEVIAFALMSTSSYYYAALFSANGPNAVFEGRDNNEYQVVFSEVKNRQRTRIAAFYAEDNYRVSFDGGPVMTDDSATIPADLDRYHFGAFGSPEAAPLNGYIRRVKCLPRATITDDEIRALLP